MLKFGTFVVAMAKWQVNTSTLSDGCKVWTDYDEETSQQLENLWADPPSGAGPDAFLDYVWHGAPNRESEKAVPPTVPADTGPTVNNEAAEANALTPPYTSERTLKSPKRGRPSPDGGNAQFQYKMFVMRRFQQNIKTFAVRKIQRVQVTAGAVPSDS